MMGLVKSFLGTTHRACHSSIDLEASADVLDRAYSVSRWFNSSINVELIFSLLTGRWNSFAFVSLISVIPRNTAVAIGTLASSTFATITHTILPTYPTSFYTLVTAHSGATETRASPTHAPTTLEAVWPDNDILDTKTEMHCITIFSESCLFAINDILTLLGKVRVFLRSVCPVTVCFGSRPGTSWTLRVYANLAYRTRGSHFLCSSLTPLFRKPPGILYVFKLVNFSAVGTLPAVDFSSAASPVWQ